MRVYISGRIKDYDDYLEHFKIGVRYMENQGHEAVNPCDLGKPTFTYEEFMREDLKALLDCQAIYMLTGWERSAGARCEHLVAAMSGLVVWYERV